MKYEKYSVLFSVYHKETPSIMKTAVDSMLNQTILAEQIVIVADGPLTNELNTLITSYVEGHGKLFTIVRLEKNMGLGLALNEGLKACRNELVARMDTDDIALTERCEKQLAVFSSKPELSIVGSNVDEFYDNPEKIVSSRNVPSNYQDIVKFSKKRNPFNHPSVMYRKSSVLASGGYGDYRRNQDYELFVRMLNEDHKAYNIPESLLLFRASADNMKRRKSWDKCKGDISIRYSFWRKGYIHFSDFIIASAGFLLSFVAPTWLFEKFSVTFLRSKKRR